MVSIIENRASIAGIVRSVSNEPDAKGFYQVSLELISSSDIEGFPNLARLDEGKEIVIKIQKSSLDEMHIQAGNQVTFPARKAFGQIYFLQH